MAYSYVCNHCGAVYKSAAPGLAGPCEKCHIGRTILTNPPCKSCMMDPGCSINDIMFSVCAQKNYRYWQAMVKTGECKEDKK